MHCVEERLEGAGAGVLRVEGGGLAVFHLAVFFHIDLQMIDVDEKRRRLENED